MAFSDVHVLILLFCRRMAKKKLVEGLGARAGGNRRLKPPADLWWWKFGFACGNGSAPREAAGVGRLGEWVGLAKGGVVG